MAQQPIVRRGRCTSMTLSVEADQAMREMIDGPKRIGTFISALILQERARQEERALLQRQLRAVYDGRQRGVEKVDST